jgi:hypothetical protein
MTTITTKTRATPMTIAATPATMLRLPAAAIGAPAVCRSPTASTAGQPRQFPLTEFADG